MVLAPVLWVLVVVVLVEVVVEVVAMVVASVVVDSKRKSASFFSLILVFPKFLVVS